MKTSIIHVLEVRTRAHRWESPPHQWVVDPWGEWVLLAGEHTYFDRRTARYFSKRLNRKATPTFAQDCQCRIVTYDRRTKK